MKSKKYFRVAIAMLMLAISPLLVGIQKTWAAEDVNTSMFVSPMVQELLLTPGEQYQGTILVSNGDSAESDLNYSIKIGSYGWSRSEDGKDDYGGLNVDNKSQRNIIMDWITLEKDSGTLRPGTQEKVLFTIDVPESAPAGAQYASILVANETKDNDEGSGESNNIEVKSVTRLASAIITNIVGATVEKGSIADNSMPSFLTTGPLEATSMVRNEGNIYTDAKYTLQVWPLFSDEEICTNEEEPETSMILPDTERYHAQTCELPTVGIFKAKQVVKIFGEISITEKTIIVCPIWLMLIIFFVIASIVIWIVMRVRGRRKSSGNVAKETK